jgi:hypothetical protein
LAIEDIDNMPVEQQPNTGERDCAPVELALRPALGEAQIGSQAEGTDDRRCFDAIEAQHIDLDNSGGHGDLLDHSKS